VKHRKDKKHGLRQEERQVEDDKTEELKTEAVQPSFF
jgi:hypothetical protein